MGFFSRRLTALLYCLLISITASKSGTIAETTRTTTRTTTTTSPKTQSPAVEKFSAVPIPPGYQLGGQSVVNESVEEFFNGTSKGGVWKNEDLNSINFDRNVEKAYFWSKIFNISSNWRLELSRTVANMTTSCTSGFAVALTTIPNVSSSPITLAEFRNNSLNFSGLAIGVYPGTIIATNLGTRLTLNSSSTSVANARFVFEMLNGNLTCYKLTSGPNGTDNVTALPKLSFTKASSSWNVPVTLLIGGSTDNCGISIKNITLYPLFPTNPNSPVAAGVTTKTNTQTTTHAQQGIVSASSTKASTGSVATLTPATIQNGNTFTSTKTTSKVAATTTFSSKVTSKATTPTIGPSINSGSTTKTSTGSIATLITNIGTATIQNGNTITSKATSKVAATSTSGSQVTSKATATTSTTIATARTSVALVNAAYQYRVTTTMKVTKVMLKSSRRRRASSDCSCLSPDDWPTDMNTTSSPMYQNVAKIFSQQIAALYQKAGFAVTADDVNITAIAPVVGTIAIIYESIVKSGSAYSEDSLKRTVTNAMQDMQAQGAFADAFGPDGVTSMNIQHVADGNNGDGGGINGSTKDAIIGGVIGGAALIAITVGVVFIIQHNQKKKKITDKQTSNRM